MREIVEEESFVIAIEKLGGHGPIDAALESLIGGLSSNPDSFDIIPGCAPIRLAKTEMISWDSKKVPPLALWFRVGHDDKMVSLLWIEEWSAEDG